MIADTQKPYIFQYQFLFRSVLRKAPKHSPATGGMNTSRPSHEGINIFRLTCNRFFFTSHSTIFTSEISRFLFACFRSFRLPFLFKCIDSYVERLFQDRRQRPPLAPPARASLSFFSPPPPLPRSLVVVPPLDGLPPPLLRSERRRRRGKWAGPPPPLRSGRRRRPG